MPIKAIQLPEAKLVAEVPSSSYPATYPLIDGPYGIPEWARASTEEIYQTRMFKGRPVRIFLLQNVYLCDEGMVFSENGEVYSTTARQYQADEISTIHRAIQQALYDGSLIIGDCPAVLCQRRGSAVYGHWMVDMLPIAFLALEYAKVNRDSTKFLLLQTNASFEKVVLDSLGHLGIPSSKVSWLSGAPSFWEKLIVVDGVSEHGKYMSPHVVECHDRIAADVVGGGRLRLFISRRGYGREIQNEEELATIAHEEGYHIFDPGQVPFIQQISAFKDAHHIIGAVGSGLANALFAPRGAALTLLSPQSMPDTFYWLLCQVKGLRYRDVRCEEVSLSLSETWPPWSCDFVLDASRFRSYLASFDGK